MYLLQRALAHEARGDRGAALTEYRALLALQPDHPGALLRVAEGEMAAQRRDEARPLLVRAGDAALRMGLGTDAASIYSTLCLLERQQGNAAAALAAAHLGQARCGEVPGLLWDECECLRELGEFPARLNRLNRLAMLQPDDPVILVTLGLALINTPMEAQAIRPLRAAFARGYRDATAAVTLARLEIKAGENDEAEARLRAVLAADSGHLAALAALWQLLRSQCRWAEANAKESEMLARLAADETHPLLRPFDLTDSAIPPLQLRAYAERENAGLPALPPLTTRFRAYEPTQRAQARGPGQGQAHTQAHERRRIRVGYLSGDFHTHAVATHVAGLFEAHDRGRFECYAFSCGPRVEEDVYRQRFKKAFEHWHDLNDLTDRDAAVLIAAQEIDVLVDMSGLTHGSRPGILEWRPAPFVLHYLGYPGTIASRGVDFLVADATVVPPEHESYYAERILRMPGCYQVNDHRRERPAATPRSELGLPDDMTVICNFNREAKWTQPFMRIWLGAIADAPRAALWLVDPGERGRAEVLAMARTFGVDERIFWAPRVSMSAHLARLAAADLSLDQLPYSSHATGANALWMGVPLLTCLGDAFPGRVGASLVRAAGLPEFVTADIGGYAARLQQLLIDPTPLIAAKRHLLEQGPALPLFDSERFTRDWEAMLLGLLARG